jgi:hypothetical protein
VTLHLGITKRKGFVSQEEGIVGVEGVEWDRIRAASEGTGGGGRRKGVRDM